MARANADIERLLAELNALKDQVADLQRGNGEPSARGVIHDAASALDAVDEVLQSTRECVREQPLLSLASAFALGLSVARLTRR